MGICCSCLPRKKKVRQGAVNNQNIKRPEQIAPPSLPSSSLRPAVKSKTGNQQPLLHEANHEEEMKENRKNNNHSSNLHNSHKNTVPSTKKPHRGSMSSLASSSTTLSVNRGATAKKSYENSAVASAAGNDDDADAEDDDDEQKYFSPRSGTNSAATTPSKVERHHQHKSNNNNNHHHDPTYVVPSAKAAALKPPSDSFKGFAASSLDFYSRRITFNLLSSSSASSAPSPMKSTSSLLRPNQHQCRHHDEVIFPLEISSSLCRRWLKSFVARLTEQIQSHEVCKQLFGGKASYHVGYTAFNGNINLLLAVENCTTFIADPMAGLVDVAGIGTPPIHTTCELEQIASCPLSTFSHEIRAILSNFGKPSDHVQLLFDRYRDREDELLSMVRSKYGPLEVPFEQRKVRFFRLSDFIYHVVNDTLTEFDDEGTKAFLFSISTAINSLKPNWTSNNNDREKFKEWKFTCVNCKRQYDAELPIMIPRSNPEMWTMVSGAGFFPGVECTSSLKHFSCFACITESVRKAVRDDVEYRSKKIGQVDGKRRECFVPCPECWNKSEFNGTYQLEDFAREIPSDLISQWTGSSSMPYLIKNVVASSNSNDNNNNNTTAAAFQRREMQVRVPLVGNAKRRRIQLLEEGNREREQDVVMYHANRLREILVPQCPMCFLELRCYSGRCAITCQRCDHQFCCLCFAPSPCMNPDHLSHEIYDGNDDEDPESQERRVKYFTGEQVFHEWGKNFLEKVLIYLEVSLEHEPAEVTEQVLREVRWDLRDRGIWPLPHPWRILIVLDELARKKIVVAAAAVPSSIIQPEKLAPKGPQLRSNSDFDDDDDDVDDEFDKYLKSNIKESSRTFDDNHGKNEVDGGKNPYQQELGALTMEFSL